MLINTHPFNTTTFLSATLFGVRLTLLGFQSKSSTKKDRLTQTMERKHVAEVAHRQLPVSNWFHHHFGSFFSSSSLLLFLLIDSTRVWNGISVTMQTQLKIEKNEKIDINKWKLRQYAPRGVKYPWIVCVCACLCTTKQCAGETKAFHENWRGKIVSKKNLCEKKRWWNSVYIALPIGNLFSSVGWRDSF